MRNRGHGGAAMAGAHARAPWTRRGCGAVGPEPQSESGRGCSQEDGQLGPQLGARQLPAGRLPRPDGTAAPSRLALTLGTRGSSASTPGQNLGSERRDRPPLAAVSTPTRATVRALPPGPAPTRDTLSPSGLSGRLERLAIGGDCLMGLSA